MTFGIIGVTLTGNMGGQAMLEAALDELRKNAPEATFRLFSLDAAADRTINPHPDLEIVNASPAKLMITSFLVSLLILLVPILRTRLRSFRPLLLDQVSTCDAMVDLAGIAFVDGRGWPLLIYNTAVCLPSFATGVPHYKLSQALGPFQQRLNRTVARYVLNHCARVIARGHLSAENLKTVGLQKPEILPDVSFALELNESDWQAARELLPSDFREPWVTVSPSRIVQTLSEAQGGHYLDALSEFVHGLRSTGVPVVIAPHSLATGRSKNNDLDCAAALAGRFQADPEVIHVDAPPNARVLRALFGLSRCVVSSRFHACVAAVSTGVPVITLAWGHKYHDLLAPFGLEHFILDGAVATAADITDAWQRLLADEVAIRDRVAAVALDHRRRARLNFSDLHAVAI
ncbi:MAG: polysaccharide pyruvyl transferase family protein [Pseudomonadales bacterium]|nr:polysaccharide pyruvyl transferase family protein [Pseudomonadales bacterium]